MADYTFEPNPDIEEQVKGLAIIGVGAMAAAERIAAIARSTAPKESGEYAASIVAEPTKTGARVHAGDFKAAWIEFGVPSHGIPAKFNLRRAVEAAGYGFKKGGGD